MATIDGWRRPLAGQVDIDLTRPHPLPAGVPAGILATITMDVAMVAASSLGGRTFTSDRLGPEMIGRWAAGLLHGRWHRDEVSTDPAQRGELALGLLTHYGTGIVLTQAFLLLPRRGGRRPSFAGGTACGIATAALPLLVMFPSMGYGLLGLRSGDAARLGRIMLLGHIAFGVGIGVWAPRFASGPAPVLPGTRGYEITIRASDPWVVSGRPLIERDYG